MKETADRLGVSVSTLIRLMHRGNLPPVRIGSRTLFDPDDLATFIRSQKETNRLAGCSSDAVVVPDPGKSDGHQET